jgi:hypothetical protein
MRLNVNEAALKIQHLLTNYYVDSQGCWIHRNKINTEGYVTLGKGKNRHPAHRLSYALYKGHIPEGLQICHTCDVRNCINPNHLFLGTHSDNMQDMSKKKRSGGRYIQLTEDEVSFIIVLHGRGYTQQRIAEIVGVGHSSVSNYLKKGR